MSLCHRSFRHNVKSWWTEEVSAKWACLKLQLKLKKLKIQLKTWKWETFGNVSLRKEKLLQTIQQLDKEEERRIISDEQRSGRIKLKKSFKK